jgi:hypothetical protein
VGDAGNERRAGLRVLAQALAFVAIFPLIYLIAPEDRRWKIMKGAAIVSAIAFVLGFGMFLLMKQMQKQKKK